MNDTQSSQCAGIKLSIWSAEFRELTVEAGAPEPLPDKTAALSPSCHSSPGPHYSSVSEFGNFRNHLSGFLQDFWLWDWLISLSLTSLRFMSRRRWQDFFLFKDWITFQLLIDYKLLNMCMDRWQWSGIRRKSIARKMRDTNTLWIIHG